MALQKPDLHEIKVSLRSMGYSDSYITRAINVHQKSRRSDDYDIMWLIEIISRLQSKDKSISNQQKQLQLPFEACFNSMNEVLAAMDLKKGKNVDYRYENGRYLLCEIVSVSDNSHHHTLLTVHPMGVDLNNKKHDRVCNLNFEYFKIRPPKSVSLRSIVTKDHNMSNVEIDSYVDINPIHQKGTPQNAKNSLLHTIEQHCVNIHIKGHEGWKHGRIIKMDANSSQVKVLYYNDKDHYNYSYWFHLEDTMEIAPFKSRKCEEQIEIKRDSNSSCGLSEISEMEAMNDDHYDDMYHEIKIDNHHSTVSTPRNSIPAFCPKYSDHHGTHVSYSHASLHSIDHHSDHEHGHNDDADYKQNESMLHQLSAFGYDADDIQDAMTHVSNPSDINQIVEYLSQKDMKKLSESAKSFHVKPVNQWKSNKMTPKSSLDVCNRSQAPSLVHSEDNFIFVDHSNDFGYASSPSSDIFSNPDSNLIVPAPDLSKSRSPSVFGAETILMNSTFVNNKDYGVPIPNILLKLKEALFANRGHLIQNVFDIKANDNQCQQIQSCLNEDKLKKVDLRRMDVVVIANLIKIWFQSLPKRILQDVDAKKIKNCQNIHDAADIIQNDIGEPNESLFKWFLDFCVDVIHFEKENNMSIKKTAHIFAPVLFDDSAEKFVQLSILNRHYVNH